MSIQPPRGPSAGQPTGEAPPPSKKRKRSEEATEEVAKKNLPGEEQVPEKKRKREVEKLEPREALIHDLTQKKDSSDPETIINCLDALHDNKLLKDGDAGVHSILQSLINTIREEAFTDNQIARVNTLLIHLCADIQDTELKNAVGDSIFSFTTSLRLPDIQNNLAFIKQTFPERLESILVAIFQTPDVKKVSLEQKIQIFSFIHEHDVQLKESTWRASSAILNPSAINTDAVENKIVAIPEKERVAIIRDSLPLLDDQMSGFWIGCIFEVVRTLPQEDRISVITNAIRLFTENIGGLGKLVFLETMRSIPQQDREVLVQDSSPLLTYPCDIGLEARVALLKAMYQVPQHERQVLIQDISPLLIDTVRVEEITVFLRKMHKVPQQERATLIQDTSSLFSSAMDGFEKASLLETMHKIPRSDRKSLIEDTTPLFHDRIHGSEKAILLEILYQVPQQERAIFIQDTIPLLHDNRMDIVDIRRILEAMRRVPRAERAALVQDCLSLFEKCKLLVYEKILIVEELLCLPKEKRSELIQEITPVFQRLRQSTKNPVIIFYLLPASLKTQDKLSSTGNLLEDPEYQAAITSSLERELADEKTPPALLMKLADFVTTQLSLHDEHPLMQQAIEILSAATVAGEKNPFSLHKKLQALAKEPIEFKPQEYVIAGTKTTFRLDILQASAKAFEVAREELPRDATEEAWNQLVQGLKQKVEADDSVKRQLEEYAATWTELWEGCLSDSYLSGLLKLSGERVSIVEAQFRAVLHHLLAQEKSVQPGKIFSEQEELLIKQAMSIQHCSGGKKEGIALTYKLLDPAFKYRAKGLEGGDPEEIRAKEFLADVLQKALSDQFSGTNALMHELTGIQQIGQAPHQAIYLKNLIGPLVGLRHDVAFDKHTGVLYDALIAKPREEVLQAFFRHFTPQDLVKELMRVVNTDFRINSKVIRDIVGEKEECWDWDEDEFFPIRLNERGALQILQKVGYLT